MFKDDVAPINVPEVSKTFRKAGVIRPFFSCTTCMPKNTNSGNPAGLRMRKAWQGRYNTAGGCQDITSSHRLRLDHISPPRSEQPAHPSHDGFAGCRAPLAFPLGERPSCRSHSPTCGQPIPLPASVSDCIDSRRRDANIGRRRHLPRCRLGLENGPVAGRPLVAGWEGSVRRFHPHIADRQPANLHLQRQLWSRQIEKSYDSCQSEVDRQRRAFICRGTALAERAGVAAADKRRWTEPPLVRWRAGLLGNVRFRRRWRGRCEGSAGPRISLREGWPAHERAWWPIDVWRSARRRRARRAGRDQLHRWAGDNGQGDGR